MTNAHDPLPTPTDPDHVVVVHDLACMEIWGGNTHSNTAVSTPGIDAFVYRQPYGGAEGGGDIHYVSLCAAGKIARFVVADVSGHGEEVADLAARLRTMMRKNINTIDQTRFARAVNEAFSTEGDAGRFATALLASYWAPSDHLIVCNAGHPRPLWYRAAEKRWELMVASSADSGELDRSTGLSNLPLGIIDPTDYTQEAFKLGRGDIVLVYTDSLTEARNASGEMLGEAGLLRVAAGLDASNPAELVPSLLDAVSGYRGAGVPSDDDVTVLALHHNASPTPAYSVWERLEMLGRMAGLG